MANVAVVVTVHVVTFECLSCGVTYGMTRDFMNARQVDHAMFYCLNGHTQSWAAGPVERLQAELAAEKRRVEFERTQRQAAERDATAQRGQVTKLRNRIQRGVCPQCNRTFMNVARHMHTKHPEGA